MPGYEINVNDHSEKQLIDKVTPLGFPFYKRIRLEEQEVRITAPQNITEFPGLQAIVQTSFEQTSGMDWGIIANETIELTLLDLIINDFVELITFTDNEFFLGKLLKREYRNCHFAIKNEYSGQDILSVSLIKSIKYIEQHVGQKADLQTVIAHLLDEYLGTDIKHEYPHKVFVLQLLKQYSQHHIWITFDIYPNNSNTQRLTIIPQWKNELKRAYEILSDISWTLRNESEIFHLYNNELYDIITSEFWRRLSSSKSN